MALQAGWQPAVRPHAVLKACRPIARLPLTAVPAQGTPVGECGSDLIATMGEFHSKDHRTADVIDNGQPGRLAARINFEP
jgi:hypothetical protein